LTIFDNKYRDNEFDREKVLLDGNIPWAFADSNVKKDYFWRSKSEWNEIQS